MQPFCVDVDLISNTHHRDMGSGLAFCLQGLRTQCIAQLLTAYCRGRVTMPRDPMSRSARAAASDVDGPWPPSGLERFWLLSVRAAILQRLVTSWQQPSAS